MLKRSRATSRIDRRQVMKWASATGVGALAAPFVGRIPGALAAWPSDKPVRIVVANSPGGPSDLMARFMAPALQQALGGTFIVENKPGGGANIGMTHVVRSQPDGYTIHLSTSVFVMNPNLYNPSPYDPHKDLVPIVELATSPGVFCCHKDLGVKTMKDLIALAKKDQNKFNIGTPPIGSTLHLAASLLKYREGLKDVAIVVHNGGGTNIQGLLTKTVQACSSSLAPAHPHIKAGTLIGLGITGDKRWPDLPDVPTLEEIGFKDLNFDTYVALMAPGKTPPEIIARIEKAAIDALSKPELRERITKTGFSVRGKTAVEHKARIEKELVMFGDIIKKAGIKIK